MGKIASAAFDEAADLAGVLGKMKLASMAGLTSAEAPTVEETPELVQRIEHALDWLRGSLHSQPQMHSVSNRIALPARSDAASRPLRQQIETYRDLMTQRDVLLDDYSGTVRRVTETAAKTLSVARVSVWEVNSVGTKISCIDLFEASTRMHSSGTELSSRDFPAYFESLRNERTIAAHDAHTDPRTSCFSEAYLTPLGITSMLDVPIWAHGKNFGVLCHEHVGLARTWNVDDENFAYLLSCFVALAIERR